jgi:hypothetical protein
VVDQRAEEGDVAAGAQRHVEVGHRARAGEARIDVDELGPPRLGLHGPLEADRVIATRAATWEHEDGHGRRLNRTRGIAFLGGATLDTEENYLIKKLFTALGAIQIENQARI